jgi:hypothetical protein
MYPDVMVMAQGYLLTVNSSHLEMIPVQVITVSLQLTDATKVVHLHVRVTANNAGFSQIRTCQFTNPNLLQHFKRFGSDTEISGTFERSGIV